MYPNQENAELEKALASSLSSLVSELRLIDISDYFGYMHYDAHESLDALIGDAAELYFSPGFVTLSCAEKRDANWGELPSVCLHIRTNGMMGQHHVSITLHDSVAEFKLLYSTLNPAIASSPDWQSVCIEELENSRLDYDPRKHRPVLFSKGAPDIVPPIVIDAKPQHP